MDYSPDVNVENERSEPLRQVVITDEDDFFTRAYQCFKASSDDDETSGVGSYHDSFMKMTLGAPQFAAEFLHWYMPEVEIGYDLDRLTVLPTEIVGKNFKKRIADFILVVPNRQSDLPALSLRIILEHKAQSGKREDAHTVAQVFSLVAASAYETLEKYNVVPQQPLGVVLYTGSDVNYGPLRWEDKIKIDDSLSRYQFRGEIACVNVTRLFERGELKGSPILRAAFTAMGSAGNGSIDVNAERIFEVLQDLDWSKPFSSNFASALLVYYARAMKKLGKDVTWNDVEYLTSKTIPKKEREEMKTLFDEAFEEAETRGYKRAIQGWLKAFFGSRSSSLQERIGQIADSYVLNQVWGIMDSSKGLEEFEKRLNEILVAHQNATRPII